MRHASRVNGMIHWHINLFSCLLLQCMLLTKQILHALLAPLLLFNPLLSRKFKFIKLESLSRSPLDASFNSFFLECLIDLAYSSIPRILHINALIYHIGQLIMALLCILQSLFGKLSCLFIISHHLIRVSGFLKSVQSLQVVCRDRTAFIQENFEVVVVLNIVVFLKFLSDLAFPSRG